jgi:hypothetical protein
MKIKFASLVIFSICMYACKHTETQPEKEQIVYAKKFLSFMEFFKDNNFDVDMIEPEKSGMKEITGRDTLFLSEYRKISFYLRYDSTFLSSHYYAFGKRKLESGNVLLLFMHRYNVDSIASKDQYVIASFSPEGKQLSGMGYADFANNTGFNYANLSTSFGSGTDFSNKITMEVMSGIFVDTEGKYKIDSAGYITRPDSLRILAHQ